MLRKMKRNARKGFALVELLIVMTIIGILSGSLLLTMGSSTDNAEATRIVTDLNSLRLAAGLYYADNAGGTLSPDIARLKSYVTAPEKLSGDQYEFKAGESGSQWFVGCKIASQPEGVREALKKMAATNGLRNSVTSSDSDTYNGGTSGVYVRVR
ncbi:MAG: type II secretion system protein [Pyramidobacter sp.]|nr:type II secretion system protein [Pyramidobacter sp.]